jgi:hypothetical protein
VGAEELQKRGSVHARTLSGRRTSLKVFPDAPCAPQP